MTIPAHTFKLGQINVDPVAYASMGNAILGIRDSGKTGTAHFFAEQLLDAGIPFIAFDPTGVWRWLRVPGAGKGYPVVVAGGQEPDLPLTVDNAVDIVEAAMESGVSVVFDLFSRDISKADWYRIVERCVKFLMHNNRGLRHLFFEEAAEFVPQRPQPGQNLVYSALESLARMGGNYRLGYTLINQRAEEVSKAVLELCDNLLLHRQKGKNSLTSIGKWLDVGNAQNTKAVKESFSTLETGMAWAWMRGENSPELVKVPLKNSAFPKRRALNDDGAAALPAKVDVGAFVGRLKAALDLAAEAQRRETLAAEEAKPRPSAKDHSARSAADAAPAYSTEALLRAELKTEYDRGYGDGSTLARKDGFEAGWAACSRKVVRVLTPIQVDLASFLEGGVEPDGEYTAHLDAPRMTPAEAFRARPGVEPVTYLSRVVPAVIEPPPFRMPARASKSTSSPKISGVNGSQRKVLEALAWWKAVGHDAPEIPMIAVVCGWRPSSGGTNGRVSELVTMGFVSRDKPGTVSLTDAGRAKVEVKKAATKKDFLEKVKGVLSGSQVKVLDALMAKYPGKMSIPEIAKAAGWAETSGGTNGRVSELCTMAIVTRPEAGFARAADWLFKVKR